MKKTILQTAIYVFALCFITACSKDSENKEGEGLSAGEHTYRIEVAGGKTYQGSVAKMAPGAVSVYHPVAFVEYSEEAARKVVTGMLQDIPGDFQFGIGVAMDDNNRPTIPESGVGLTFGQRMMEDKYGPAGPVSLTMKDYKEHSIALYGEEGTVASFTPEFSGHFKKGDAGEPVDVTGEVVVVAP